MYCKSFIEQRNEVYIMDNSDESREVKDSLAAVIKKHTPYLHSTPICERHMACHENCNGCESQEGCSFMSAWLSKAVLMHLVFGLSTKEIVMLIEEDAEEELVAMLKATRTPMEELL